MFMSRAISSQYHHNSSVHGASNNRWMRAQGQKRHREQEQDQNSEAEGAESDSLEHALQAFQPATSAPGSLNITQPNSLSRSRSLPTSPPDSPQTSVESPCTAERVVLQRCLQEFESSNFVIPDNAFVIVLSNDWPDKAAWWLGRKMANHAHTGQDTLEVQWWDTRCRVQSTSSAKITFTQCQNCTSCTSRNTVQLVLPESCLEYVNGSCVLSLETVQFLNECCEQAQKTIVDQRRSESTRVAPGTIRSSQPQRLDYTAPSFDGSFNLLDRTRQIHELCHDARTLVSVETSVSQLRNNIQHEILSGIAMPRNTGSSIAAYTPRVGRVGNNSSELSHKQPATRRLFPDGCSNDSRTRKCPLCSMH